MPYRSVNPATGEVLKTCAEHTDEQVLGALRITAFHEKPSDRRCGEE
jgi:hypothetical protein